MALPDVVPTKISSEAAGYVNITPVAQREMPLAELVEQILGVTGKDSRRIREILSRGSFVGGSARYRWPPIEAAEGELHSLLEGFPDPEPGRSFEAAKCRSVTLKGRHGTLELTREVASERRWFKKQSFWEILIPALEACSPSYLRYSYSDRADVYEAPLSMETIRRLQACAGLLKQVCGSCQATRILGDRERRAFGRALAVTFQHVVHSVPDRGSWSRRKRPAVSIGCRGRSRWDIGSGGNTRRPAITSLRLLAVLYVAGLGQAPEKWLASTAPFRQRDAPKHG